MLLAVATRERPPACAATSGRSWSPTSGSSPPATTALPTGSRTATRAVAIAARIRGLRTGPWLRRLHLRGRRAESAARGGEARRLGAGVSLLHHAAACFGCLKELYEAVSSGSATSTAVRRRSRASPRPTTYCWPRWRRTASRWKGWSSRRAARPTRFGVAAAALSSESNESVVDGEGAARAGRWWWAPWRQLVGDQDGADRRGRADRRLADRPPAGWRWSWPARWRGARPARRELELASGVTRRPGRLRAALLLPHPWQSDGDLPVLSA